MFLQLLNPGRALAALAGAVDTADDGIGLPTWPSCSARSYIGLCCGLHVRTNINKVKGAVSKLEAGRF